MTQEWTTKAGHVRYEQVSEKSHTQDDAKKRAWRELTDDMTDQQILNELSHGRITRLTRLIDKKNGKEVIK